MTIAKNPFIQSNIKIQRRESEQIMTSINRGNFISILAPRKSGKTLLIKEIEKQIDNNDGRAVYVSFVGHNTTREEITRYFSQTIVTKLTENEKQKLGDSIEDLNILLKHLQDIGKFIFLIDELPSPESVAFRFICDIRAYYQECFAHRNFSQFVFAGSIDLGEFTRDQNSFISPFNIAANFYLSDFDETEVTRFIRENMKGKRNSIFTKEVIKKLFEYTQGHPFLLKELCVYFYDHREQVTEGLKEVSTLISMTGIETNNDVTTMIGEINKNRESRQLLQHILEGEDIHFLLAHKGIRHLFLNGTIRKNENGHCAIRNPIYQELIQRNFEISAPSSSTKKGNGVWLAISLQDEEGVPLTLEENRYCLQQNKTYQLKVTLSSFEPDVSYFKEPLTIKKPSRQEPALSEFRVGIESFHDLGANAKNKQSASIDLGGNFMNSFLFSIIAKDKSSEFVVLIGINKDNLPVKTVKFLFEVS